MQGYPDARVYGKGNEDLGSLNGGEMPFEELKKIMRNARAYVYAGTFPASYTLSIMEAMMTGIPVIAISKRIAEISDAYQKLDFYEVSDIITNGSNGFIADSIDQFHQYIDLLINNKILADQISANGRKTAIEYWGKEKIKEQWRVFLDR